MTLAFSLAAVVPSTRERHASVMLKSPMPKHCKTSPERKIGRGGESATWTKRWNVVEPILDRSTDVI